MNTCYKHFYYFISEFSLVDKKELEPLVSIQCVIQFHCNGCRCSKLSSLEQFVWLNIVNICYVMLI